jgi:hypothetical protein
MRFKIVKDPKIIYAVIKRFKGVDVERLAYREQLRIRISSNKEYFVNRTGTDGKSIPVIKYISIGMRSNSRTKYKEIISLLRNPQNSILYTRSENRHLKYLSSKILQGYNVIFPRERRYNTINKLIL